MLRIHVRKEVRYARGCFCECGEDSGGPEGWIHSWIRAVEPLAKVLRAAGPRPHDPPILAGLRKGRQEIMQGPAE